MLPERARYSSDTLPIRTLVILGVSAALLIVVGVALIVFCFSEAPDSNVAATKEQPAIADDAPPESKPGVLPEFWPKDIEKPSTPAEPAVVPKAKDEIIQAKAETKPEPTFLGPAVFEEGEKKFIAGPLVPSKSDKAKYRILRSANQASASRPLRLAVTPPAYDDMGRLLMQLGSGYQFATLDNNELYDSIRLGAFDAVFLTCAASSPPDPRAVAGIRSYVERGGTLYASDLRYDMLRAAFPAYALKNQVFAGVPQTIQAKVLDNALSQSVGAVIPLHFETGGWKPAAFDKFKVKVLIEGPYQSEMGAFTAPLLVRFRHQKGTVIFTSFHNASQNSELEKKLLEFLVFSAVTAQAEGFTARGMSATGYTPRESKNLTFAKRDQRRTGSFKHDSVKSLQFALGFENQGGKLRIELISPAGEKIEHEDSASFIIEVQNAQPGVWQYAVVANTLPFLNFPCTLLVGEKTK